MEREDVVARVREATGGGADVVVDTTPLASESVAQAVAMAAPRARIVLAGLEGRRATPGFFADDVVYKELSLQGVLGMPYEDFERAVEMLESRRYPFEKLHTHSFPVEQAEQAIRALASGAAGAIHVAIVPGAPAQAP